MGIPVTADERADYIRRITAGGLYPSSADDIGKWPDFVPPAANLHPFCSPAGQLVVLHNTSLAEPDPVYDFIDRSGVLVGQLFLRTGERIVGFGSGSLYLAARDSVGFEALRKHPYRLPGSGGQNPR